MLYLQLFWAFVQIGLFSIGGGYAAMPLIQAQVVDRFAWLSMGEFTDLITISQMTPGPIAINSATFVGTRIAGLGGAIVATLGCVLPSTIIVLTLAYFYRKYRKLELVQTVLKSLRPAVVGMIASAGYFILIQALWPDETKTISLAHTNWFALAMILTALFFLRKVKTNPILVMLLAGVVGGLVYSFFPV